MSHARFGFALIALLSLASCGVTFTAQSVSKNNTSLDVTVVEMTPTTISTANSQPYTPLKLPAAFAATAGAGGSPRGLGALPQPPAVPNLTPPNALELRIPPKVETGSYLIGIGDVMLLATRATTSVVLQQTSGIGAAQSQTQGYTVRDDGAIAIPEVGAVAVAGLTIEQAEDRVFQRLVQNQIDPEFSLSISGFNSKHVSIGGAVTLPTVAPITMNPLRLEQAITAAGGFTLEDQTYALIRIYRDGTLYQIPLKDYFADPALQKIILVDGDSVYVDTAYDLSRAQAYYEQEINALDLRQRARSSALSELQAEISMRRAELDERRALFNERLELSAIKRDNVYLVGEVAEQALVPLPFEQKASLAEVLLQNGGISTVTGNPAQIYVLRADTNDNVAAYHLDARNAVNLTLATRFELHPNDIVFVKAQPITTWGRALQQALPILFNTGADRL